MQRISLTYSEDFNQCKGYLLQSNPTLDKILNQNTKITAEGNPQSHFMINTHDQTFQLCITKTRYTMLITEVQNGKIKHQLQHILSLEKCLPKYHEIYGGLMERSVTDNQYFKDSFANIVKSHCFSTDQILQAYKISRKELLKFITFTNCVQVFEDIWICLSNSVLTILMRNLIIFLNQKQMLHEQFQFKDIQPQTGISSKQILKKLSTKFRITSKEQKYLINVQSIIRFVILDLASAKNIYMKSQFDTILKQTLSIYLPIGTVVPNQIKQIGEYFIYTPKNNLIIHYDPLLIEATVPQRLKFMEKMKLRFSYNQIIGIFYGMPEGINIDEVCLKNFRNYGLQYQIKLLLIGKKKV